MKKYKFLSQAVFLFLIISAIFICKISVNAQSLNFNVKNFTNNLTIINKVYKFVCEQPYEFTEMANLNQENENNKIINENKKDGESEKTKEEQKVKENENQAQTQSEQEKNEKKYIALTFDDGPHPEYTAKILHVLAEKNVPATFFVVGMRTELHPTQLRRMREYNCEIGNHTYDHVDLVKMSGEDFMRQMEKCNIAIYNAIGEYPKLYRPPFGKISKANEKLLDGKMRKILWTVDSEDWKTPDKNAVVNQVVKNVKNKSIILMHDFYKQSLEALPEIIDELRKQGYEFLTVSKLKEVTDLPANMEYFIN